MGRMATLLGKDLKIILRNRTLLVTLVLYPLLMVTIVGLVFADPEQKAPVAIVIAPSGNNDVTIGEQTFSLDEVTDVIEDVARAEIQRPGNDLLFTRAQDAARDQLRNGDVDAVLVFPDFFLRDLLFEFDKRVDLLVLLDESDPAKSTVAENVIRAAVQQFNERIVRHKVNEVVAQLNIALNGDPDLPSGTDFQELRETLVAIRDDPNTSPSSRNKINESIDFVDVAIEALQSARPTMESVSLPIRPDIQHIDSGVLFARDIVVPATVALSIFWTGILASSSLSVFERQSHAQIRLNVSPVGYHQIVASKLLLTSGILLLQSLVIVLIAKGLWDIRLDNLGLLIVMVIASAFAAVGIGILVAGFSRDTNGSTLLSVLLVFPMMFLSGLFFPISFMPPFAQALARLLPLTYAVDGLRGAMLKNYTFENATVDLTFLVILGGVALLVGYIRNARLARGG